MTSSAYPAPALVWYGQRGLDAALLATVGSLRAIICCDWGEEMEEAFGTVATLSIERETRQRPLWSSSSLALIPAQRIRDVLAVAASDVEISLVPYRTTAACEAAVNALPRGRIRLVGPPSRVVDRLDDKRTQRRLFEDWGFPTPRWSLASWEDLRAGASRRLSGVGYPAIVQAPRGSLGRGTFLLSSPDDGQSLRGPFREASSYLVSQFVEGPVVNTTAVIARDQVDLAWPSVQLTSLRGCAPPGYPFAYCGNDFGAVGDLPEAALEELFDLKSQLGRALRGEGFLGLFGADWIYDGTDWYLLEINPRFQGSTVLLAALEAERGISPLIADHLRAFLGGAAVPARRRPARPEALAGAHLLLYQGCSEAVTTGVSQPSGSGPLQRSSAPGGAADWTLTGVPAPGTTVAAGAILGKIVADGRVLDSGLTSLTPKAAAAAEGAYRTLGVPAPPPLTMETDAR